MKALIALLVCAAIAAAAGLLAPVYDWAGGLRFASEMFLYLAMAQMWNLLAGYAGLLCMGQQMFIGLGTYCLFYTSLQLHVSPYWAMPVSFVFCGLMAALAALFMFRLRLVYFAIGTWVLSDMIASFISRTPELGGASGYQLSDVLPLINFDWFDEVIFWIAAAIAFATVWGAYALMRSSVGLGLMSIRDNDLAASSLGVDVWTNRFIVFVIAGAGCGLAGAVYFTAQLAMGPAQAFDPNWVVAMLFITIVGGIGTLEGPILGTAIYFALREVFTNVLGLSGAWYLIALGGAAMVVMLYAPNGLWPVVRDRFNIRGLSVRRQPPKSLLAQPAE
ncbi:MAG TPA: branched-chain amino acid ABC transporter permease [Stellaceae bacterium]